MRHRHRAAIRQHLPEIPEHWLVTLIGVIVIWWIVWFLVFFLVPALEAAMEQ